MKKNCFKCNKYTKIKSSKISYIFDKSVVVCSNCGNKDQKVYKEE